MSRRHVTIALAFLLLSCGVQTVLSAPPIPNSQNLSTYDNETQDFGVPPTTIIRTGDFDAPTPTQIIGAKTVITLELQQMMTADPSTLLIDVIGGTPLLSIPGAISLRGAGLGNNPYDQTQDALQGRLSELTGGNKARAIVFFCGSKLCWLAHNATVRAVKLGYSNIYWYRGGRRAWDAAGLPFRPVIAVNFLGGGPIDIPTPWQNYQPSLRPALSISVYKAELPNNVIIVAPGPDVPRQIRGLSGRWTGWVAQNARDSIQVAVKRLGPSGGEITVAYASGALNLQTKSFDASMKLANGDELQGNIAGPDGIEPVSIRLRADGNMDVALLLVSPHSYNWVYGILSKMPQ